jgi:hypothetical protein
MVLCFMSMLIIYFEWIMDLSKGCDSLCFFYIIILLFFLVIIFCITGAWTQGLHLEPLHQPYFCEMFFSREGLAN